MKKGWKIVSFGELGRVFNGNSISEAEKKAHFEGLEEGTPYIGTKDVGFDHEVKYESGVRIPDDERDGFKLAPANTVLVCAEGGSAGRKIAHIDRAVYFGNKLFAICPAHPNSSRFAFYYCLSDDFAKQFRGAMAGLIGGVSMNKFKKLTITLPPLSEQQRIVGLLDEAFAGLATAKANAEKNHQNARALFESHLQSIFTQRGKGWVEKKLGDITEFKNGLNYTRQSNGQTLRIVGVGDFQDRSVVPVETLQSVTIDGELGDDYLIQRDDILTVRSNGSRDLVGRCMLVPNVDEATSFSGFIIRLRVDTREISPRFLLHFMKSSVTRERLTGDGGGANISNINQAKLAELPISLPSFKQQEDIADRLDDLHVEAQRLAHLYERKLAALEALKKSLLQQAFRGEL